MISVWVRARCFNPCYVGFSFRTVKVSMRPCTGICFNPCYVGFSFRTRQNNGNLTIYKIVFQSLLCWIFFSDTLEKSILKKNKWSFNPCYVGFSFRTSFSTITPSFLASFNPCYVGFSFRTLPGDHIYCAMWVFQSLLCWIFFSDITETEVKPRFNCVSILVMLDFLFGRVSNAITTLLIAAFQSLLCWIFFLDVLNDFVIIFASLVSILVMLDFLFGQISPG